MIFEAADSSFPLVRIPVESFPMTWTPWRFMLVAIAGWMNRQQQDVIADLREENRVL